MPKSKSKALRKKGEGGDHTALTAPEAPAWKPTQSQLRAIDFIAIEPGLATRHLELCNLMQMHPACWGRWNRKPEFRQWWNAQLIEIARLRSGPALMRLVQLLEDPDTEPRDASKLADTFLKHVGVDATPNASGALIAIMEKWKGRRMRFAMEVDGGDATDVPTTDGSYPAPSDLFSALHKDYYRKLEPGQISLENPPPGAMQMGPRSTEHQARVTLETVGNLEGEGGSESETDDGSGKGPHKLGISPGADLDTRQPDPAFVDVVETESATDQITIPPPGIVDPDDVDPEDVVALEELGLVDHVRERMGRAVDDDG